MGLVNLVDRRITLEGNLMAGRGRFRVRPRELSKVVNPLSHTFFKSVFRGAVELTKS
jgi:hypothetical protein